MRVSTFFKVSALALALSSALQADEGQYFKRIATFPVCQQIEENCNTDAEVAAEIVVASQGGKTLLYTSSPSNALVFVQLDEPSQPQSAGMLDLAGEPTSVAIKDNLALVAINTSKSYTQPSGQLTVIDIKSKEVVASLDLKGQPDSIAVSPDGQYAAVAIENERDEEAGDGKVPQMPAGHLMIIDLQGEPSAWQTRQVALTGLADVAPEDPEPEYVSINQDNIAVVSLQENNHLVLVDLVGGKVSQHFSAGTADLQGIDLAEEEPALVRLADQQKAVPREPDGVTWISNEQFATANEGDMDGGSRSFSIFNTAGKVLYDSGNSMELETVRMGHYPDKRSGNKGNEPENVAAGTFHDVPHLFVNSERSSLVFVYDTSEPSQPRLKQVLPAAVAPEGAYAIPARDLVVVASEEDDRGGKMRSALNIYHYGAAQAAYPTLVSVDQDNAPIAWGALSGLAADPEQANTLYSIEDSFYQQSRIFQIDTSKTPAEIVEAVRLMDNNNVLAKLPAVRAPADAGPESGPRKQVFDEADRLTLINEDKSINIDPEGIAVASDGGFWIASEGAGTVSDADKRPVNSLNMLLKTNAEGVIEQVITLPEAWNERQVRFGFEGVAEADGKVYVALQRAWGEDDNPRIAIYDLASGAWSSVFYPLDKVESPHGGWVGLSDITALGDGEFLVLERDNQGGPDAAIKRLYRINLADATADSTVEKNLVRDLMPDLKKAHGLVAEKVEGLAVAKNGDVYIVNDNDGVDDNSGETQLLNLGPLK